MSKRLRSGPELSRRQFIDATLVAAAGASGWWLPGCAPRDRGGSESEDKLVADDATAAIVSSRDQAGRARAVQHAIELLGGMPWLKRGDRVLIKPAHNSPGVFPYTASSSACGTLARLCLDAGASQVTIADTMGLEYSLLPGGFHFEPTYERALLGFDPDDDATVLAMRKSGLVQGVLDEVGAGDVGMNRRVKITSFRELGWRRYESAADTRGTATLHADWVKRQLGEAVDWEGQPTKRPYQPRKFDFLRHAVPGMYFPRALDEVDHIINLSRTATHILSHWSGCIKNWVGIMRPDDRLWMHQFNYIKNRRHAASDPASSESPYHEMLAELHVGTVARERLMFCDATQAVVSGGPDHSDKELAQPNLMFAAKDLVSGDVMQLALLKMAILGRIAASAGQCEAQPQSGVQLAFEVLAGGALWHGGTEHMRGLDPKLCDPSFSPWDWVAVRRARELGMGATPATFQARFSEDATFGVSPTDREFLARETAIAPKF